MTGAQGPAVFRRDLVCVFALLRAVVLMRGGLDGVLPSPLPRGSLVSGAVSLVDVRNLGHQWVVGVRVREHGADGEKHCE